MEKIFNSSDKIGNIVAQLPKASQIFKKYNIDFCCGGNRTLSSAINEQQLDEDALLEELNQTYQETKNLNEKQLDWREAPFSDLIDFIINKHHSYLQTTLPALSELTTTVLRAHGTNHKELSQVHKLFHTLKMELEQHLITEEEVLFPLIKEYEKTGSKILLAEVKDTIEQLENEHEGAGDILKELKSITNKYKKPEDACPTYEKTYKLMQELESDIFEHIHLENNILHPRLLHNLED